MLAAVRKAFVDAQKVGQTEYLQVVQNWGAQAGARTNHLCLDLYDLPQIPHRVAEEIGGAARYVIREGECPYCRLAREEPRTGTRMVWQDDASVAFAPFASRSPFEVWIVPRRHAADFAAGHRRRHRLDGRGSAPGPGPAGLPRRPASQSRPARGAAPRARRRDVPLALGGPPAASRDRRAGAGDGPAGQPGLPGGGRGGVAAPPARRGKRPSCHETRAIGAWSSQGPRRLPSNHSRRAGDAPAGC